jgi:dTMP kinase
MSSGRYIAFEGAEACGKSTHAARVAARLDGVLTRETGGTAIGAQIRSILHDPANAALDNRAEALLTAADRAQHLATVVQPALDAGRHVISDRSVYSTLAYQGYGRGLDLDAIRTINRWATKDRWPDLVLFIDVPDDVLERRMRGRTLDRFELEGRDFHARVRDGFAAMAAADPTVWATIDGSGSVTRVGELIDQALAERLGL